MRGADFGLPKGWSGWGGSARSAEWSEVGRCFSTLRQTQPASISGNAAASVLYARVVQASVPAESDFAGTEAGATSWDLERSL